MFRIHLEKALSSMDISVEETQLTQCVQYNNLLMEWNERLNLTRIVEPKEVAVKHFADSAVVMKVHRFHGSERIIDVGTGAGFPGLVLKILLPQLRITLLDSVAKRLRFLEKVVQDLALKDVDIVHARAELYAKERNVREGYDMAIARAVADMPVLCEYLFPFVSVGGSVICMKGPGVADELQRATKAIHTLGGGNVHVEKFDLPFEQGERSLIAIEKIRSTPAKYPRRPGDARRKPIGSF